MATFKVMSTTESRPKSCGKVSPGRATAATLSALTLSALLSAAPANAEFFIHAWESHHTPAKILQLAPEFSYYRTTTNFSANGTPVSPDGLIQLQKLLGDATVGIGVNSRLSFFGRLSWAATLLDGASATGTSYGLGDQTVGAVFRLFEGAGGTSLDVQVQTDFPAYNNSDLAAAGLPFRGDGSTDITSGAFLRLPLVSGADSTLTVDAGGGYTYRSDSFSAALPWSAKVSYAAKMRGLSASAGAFGIFSLKNDPVANAEISGRSSSGAGGSFLVNAVNPSLVNLRGQLGFRFSPDFELQASAILPVWGQAAPSGFTAMLGAQMSWQRGATSGPKAKGQFQTYILEAKIVRTHSTAVTIDKGSNDGVTKGQIFHIFQVRQDGSAGELIATATVTRLTWNEAELAIQEYYKEVSIEDGFVARRPL